MIPVRQFLNLRKGSVRNLGGEEPKERFPRPVVLHCLISYKIQAGKCVNVIAIGGIGIFLVILKGRIIGVRLMIDVLCHAVGLEFHKSDCPSLRRRIP